MSLLMLVILVMIVVPGYFLINRLATKIFWGDEALEDQTESRYGFNKLEEELAKEDEKIKEETNKEKRKRNGG